MAHLLECDPAIIGLEGRCEGLLKLVEPDGAAERRLGIRVGEEERIALRRERVILATAGGASMRQIAAELDVSVATVHEDVNAELLAVRDRTPGGHENVDSAAALVRARS